jgi:hypothetical protein
VLGAVAFMLFVGALGARLHAAGAAWLAIRVVVVAVTMYRQPGVVPAVA